MKVRLKKNNKSDIKMLQPQLLTSNHNISDL